MLKDYETLQKMHPDSEEIQANGVLYHYSVRDTRFENLSLAEYASQLRIVFNKMNSTKSRPFDDNVEDDPIDINEPNENNSENILFTSHDGKVTIKKRLYVCQAVISVI